MHRLHVPVPFVNKVHLGGRLYIDYTFRYHLSMKRLTVGIARCASVDRVDYSSNKMPNASPPLRKQKGVFSREPRQDIFVLEYILIKIFIP